MTQENFAPNHDDRPVVPDESDPEAPADDLNREEPVPDEDATPELTPEDVTADVEESDPNGNGPAGLAGDMGVSSEREGTFQRSTEEGTHTAGHKHPSAPEAPASLDPDQ